MLGEGCAGEEVCCGREEWRGCRYHILFAVLFRTHTYVRMYVDVCVVTLFWLECVRALMSHPRKCIPSGISNGYQLCVVLATYTYVPNKYELMYLRMYVRTYVCTYVCTYICT